MSDEAKPLLLTEGPETGLSVWLATGYETFIALGAMSNHQPPPNRVVVVCRDDDPLQSAADKGLTRALTAWRQGDADVRIATPWPERRGDRSDFNDVLQVGGGAAVRARIEAAIRPQPTEGRPVRLPLGEARTTLSGAMKCFFTAAAAFDEKMATTLETARTEVTDDIEAKAPDDVRAFMARRVAAHTARAVAHEAQRAATEARAKVRMARQATAQAREAFIVARVTAARSSPADRLAARAQRERLSDAWHRACEDLVAARLDAAAARTVRRAATDAAKPRAAAEETTQLKNAAARTTREIGRLAEEHAAIAVGPPPYHALRVDVGGGKSTEARHLAAIRLAEMRAAGDGRTALFMVPTITLADEQARLFINLPEVEAAGLTAAVWRGRQRPDPDHLDFDNRDILDDYKTKMCRDPDAVADAQEALADVQTSVCRRKNPDGTIGSQCRFYEECGYQAQRDRRADIWFAAHEMLFERKPEAMGKPAFVIVDESAWQDGLIGIGSDRRRLSLDTLAQDVTVQDDPLAGERLRFLRRRAFEALSGLPDGPVPRAAIEETGMTSQSAAEARAIEWQSKVDAAIFPGMSIAARKAAVKAAANNKTIARLSLFWRAIEALMQSGGPAASGWAKLTVEDARNGAVRTIELKGRKEIAAEMVLPTLILDATMQPDLLRWFWPNLEVTADIAIRTLHQRVVQVQDRTYSKNHLRQPGNFRDIRAILFRLAREYAPGRVLGVIQQEFEEALRSCGGLPDNLDLAHHNDVAGKDGWRDVVALMVIGRTAPSPQIMEQVAEVLSGEAIARSTTWYPQADVVREMADGSYRPAQSDRHPHSLAEACRWSVAESEVVQIIGRARGCNRTETDPVDIWVLSNMPLQVPVDRLISAKDLTPSPGDLMAAEGGVAFTNATDGAAAYPCLWASRDAARKAMEPGRSGRLATFPYKNVLIRECRQPLPEERPGMARVVYQLAGPGKKPGMAWVDLALVPDPAAWLAGRLGDLVRYELAELPRAAAALEPDVEVLMPAVDPGAGMHDPLFPSYVPAGYGDRPTFFLGMKASGAGVVSDILTVAGTGETLLVMASGAVIGRMRNHPPPASLWR